MVFIPTTGNENRERLMNALELLLIASLHCNVNIDQLMEITISISPYTSEISYRTNFLRQETPYPESIEFKSQSWFDETVKITNARSAYDWDTSEIYLNADLLKRESKQTVCSWVVHEFAHHLQYILDMHNMIGSNPQRLEREANITQLSYLIPEGDAVQWMFGQAY